MYLIFDTETTGLPRSWQAPITDTSNWPRMVQLAWQLQAEDGRLLSSANIIIRPEGFDIPFNASKVHGITTSKAKNEGIALIDALAMFLSDLNKSHYVAGHNVEFDINVLGCEMVRLGLDPTLLELPAVDTMKQTEHFCALPGGKGGKFKYPTLVELHIKVFGAGFESAHDAAFDVHATALCLFELLKRGVISAPGLSFNPSFVYEAPALGHSNFESKPALKTASIESVTQSEVSHSKDDHSFPFVHFHCHSGYSVLQSTSDPEALVVRAKELGMPALALTDKGNLMGAFAFTAAAEKHGIKSIIGCEINLCRDHTNKSEKDDGYSVILLAMNKEGYHNLVKLVSRAHTDGFYYVPRIDRALLTEYASNLIALTGGIHGEVPSLLLNQGEGAAEDAFLWWKHTFPDRLYAQLSAHDIEEEVAANEALTELAIKHNIPLLATNESFYIYPQDSEAQDTLLCIRDGENLSTPIKYLGKRGREFRYGLPNCNFYLQSGRQMKRLFDDRPDAIENTLKLASRCESYKLTGKTLLPGFSIPDEFIDPDDVADSGRRGEMAYLRHLTHLGASKRYTEINPELQARLDFELQTIADTGYPGYFLIVADFCAEARKMDVSVGPGRGSAAGSVVAYCLRITNVDPIKYGLLFERFLNPDRKGMPDIDIDFDDEGREKVIKYVINKYGKDRVAQIITYGTLAAKSSVRDTGRVLQLPLSDTDRLAKLLPAMTLKDLLRLPNSAIKEKLNNPEEYAKALELKKIAEGNGMEAETIRQAAGIEGSVRNIGTHACGIIITPSILTDYVPVSLAKGSDMWCTQYDNASIEKCGLLKMDFLGLKTLTLLKDAVKIIALRNGMTIDLDALPLDDSKTYDLFRRGETVGIFQYESLGMQKHLRELKPGTFDDLIAMNALYRPGPMDYIESFINRKHGREAIAYDLPQMEEFLKDTYGITVYQEQVMLLSQKLAGFSKGKADTLRKAMGKKLPEEMAKLKAEFLAGTEALGVDPVKSAKIWSDWESFAEYAFNKSHSTCYALIGYQTAWLKANYPAEYMAAVLSNNMNDIKQVGFFMEECKRMGIAVLGPDVNESHFTFAVNERGAIRFGLGAMKGVGEGAVNSIVSVRKEGAPYLSIFDFAGRVSLKDCNKRVFDALAPGGAFDCFSGVHRARYFALDDKGRSTVENAIKYGSAVQSASTSAQSDLFGDGSKVSFPEPVIPECLPWSDLEKLKREKEIVSMFISGHPLDNYGFELRYFCESGGLAMLNDMSQTVTSDSKRELRFAGIVNALEHRTSNAGKPFGKFVLEDFEATHEFVLFGEEYLNYRKYMVNDMFLLVAGHMRNSLFKQGKAEFKISRMEVLADVRDKMLKGLRVKLPLSTLNDQIVSEFKALTEASKGKLTLRLDIVNDEKRISMTARHGVAPDPQLISFLEGLENVEIKSE